MKAKKVRVPNTMNKIGEMRWGIFLKWLFNEPVSSWFSSFLLLLSLFEIIMIGLIAITLFLWPWVLVLFWARIIAFTVYPETRLLVVVLITITGFLLYLARAHMRPLYGLAEIMIGAATCWAILGNTSASKLVAGFAMAAGVYVIVRGFDNLIDEESLFVSNNKTPDNHVPES